MPCYYPLSAERTHAGDIIFASRGHEPISLPCGQCFGCRIKRSRNWAIRCMHEAQMSKANCYITLTYNSKNVPSDGSLRYRDFQLFMKKLRKAAFKSEIIRCDTRYLSTISATRRGRASSRSATKAGAGPRFYMGGEYGPKHGRPHFHACLFVIDFQDRVYHGKSPSGAKVYGSDELARIWGNGYVAIGDVTFQSAAYIARYIMKKQTGDGLEYYEITDPDTGEITRRKKEFNNMSRDPGIGKPWLDKFHTDVYPEGKVIVNKHQVWAPRYYDNQVDELTLEAIQHARYLEAKAHSHDQSPERLRVQEQVAKARARGLLRGKI